MVFPIAIALLIPPTLSVTHPIAVAVISSLAVSFAFSFSISVVASAAVAVVCGRCRGGLCAAAGVVVQGQAPFLGVWLDSTGRFSFAVSAVAVAGFAFVVVAGGLSEGLGGCGVEGHFDVIAGLGVDCCFCCVIE